jgi:glycerate 2-kinase
MHDAMLSISARSSAALVCLDKFKGSLTAADACAALTSGLVAADPSLQVSARPVADGGEGTVDALLSAGYAPAKVRVTGPDGRPVDATLALRGSRAVVELAQAAGLHLSDHNAIAASTYGVGEMIRAALDLGCTEIVLALGGSATTDGGAGMLHALGAQLLDASGRELSRGGGELTTLATVDLTGLDPRLPGTTLIAAADVENPLLGADGAAEVYGPQKGADASDVKQLEAGLARFAKLMEEQMGSAIALRRGAGAAGGTGFAAFCLGAKPQSGIQFILDETGISRELASAGIVIVGEGSLDHQSLQGKAPIAIARQARELGVPVVAVVGQVHLPVETMADVGIVAAYTLLDAAHDFPDAMTRAAELLHTIGIQVAERHRPQLPSVATAGARTHNKTGEG